MNLFFFHFDPLGGSSLGSTFPQVFHCVHFEAPAMGDAEAGQTGGGSGESSQDEMSGAEEGEEGGQGGAGGREGEEQAEPRNQLQGIPADQVHHHDPLQLPLGAGQALPVLAMGGAGGGLQGLDGGQGQGRGGHVMGAVPRAIRAARRNNNPSPP